MDKEYLDLLSKYRKKFGESYSGVKFNSRFTTIEDVKADIKKCIKNNQPQEEPDYSDDVYL